MINKNKLYLYFIILTAVIVRLYNITYQSIWIDEAFSIHHAEKSIWYVLSLNDSTPPLYYTILHLWIFLWGDSSLSVRILSAIFGVLSVYVIYLLASFMFNKRIGIYSSIITSLSPLHVYYSQEARAYSLLFLMSILSMYFYSRFIKDLKISSIIFYIISSVLLLYSHAYGIFIIIAQNIHYFLTNSFTLSRKKRAWILTQVGILIFYLPWLLKLQFLPRDFNSWIPAPNFIEFIGLVYRIPSGQVLSSFGFVLMLIFTILIIRFRLHHQKNLLLLLLWIFVPVLIPFIFSLVFLHIFIHKYVLFVSFPVFIIAANSISNFSKRAKSLFLVLLIIFSLITIIIQSNTLNKDRWEEVSEFVVHNKKPNDKIVIIKSYETIPFLYYFDHDCFKSVEPLGCSSSKGLYGFETIDDLRSIKDNEFLLIVSRLQYNNDSKNIMIYINKTYDKTLIKEFKIFDYYIPNELYDFIDDDYKNLLIFNKIEVIYLKKKFN